MRPLQSEDVVVAQYKGQNKGGKTFLAYIDGKTVPIDSLNPIFAAAAPC